MLHAMNSSVPFCPTHTLGENVNRFVTITSLTTSMSCESFSPKKTVRISELFMTGLISRL
jgi:hypothetical protein